MKKYHLILIALSALAACQTPAAKTQAFIPGSYVSSAAGAYSSARDTLVFSRLDQSHYQLVRRTVYVPIRNGKTLPGRHQVKSFQTVWDPLKQELTEENNGLVFRFNADSGLVYVGKATYHKLN